MLSKGLILLGVTILIENSVSACLDKFALSSVNAYVHKQRNAKAIRFDKYNFNLLDDYLTIDVIHANVSQLCEGMIKNFPRLETLSAINVNLTVIEPGAFQEVPKLKHLSLSVNQLTTIQRGVFNTIPHLKVVYLTRNLIDTIEDGAFSLMPELKAVHLDHNRILTLTGNVFFGSPRISLVDFSHNLIRKIQKDAFDDLRPSNATEHLNIHLKANQITEVDKEALIPLVPVQLHLESNEISLISDIVTSVKENSVVYLTNNLIGCVSDDVIDWVKGRNVVVDLRRNPVTCECVERIEQLMEGVEFMGELNVVTTLPCESEFSFFGNEA